MERRAWIRPKVGLHARPASDLVKAVNAGGIPVRIGRPGDLGVDAHSILAVLNLGLSQHEEVVLHADGAHAREVLDGLVAVLEIAEE